MQATFATSTGAGVGANPTSVEAAELEAEQLRGLVAHMTAGLALASLFAVALAWHVSDQVAHSVVFAWLGTKLGVLLPRAWFLARARTEGPRDFARLNRINDSLLLLDGLAWGAAGLLFTRGDRIEAVVVAACLSCVACVATFGLQSRLRATQAYVGPMIVLTAAGMAIRGDELGWFWALGLVLPLMLTFATAKRGERRLAELVGLRLLTQQISEERAQALVQVRRQSEFKSRMIATVSHEIRTPLHGLLGVVAMLRDEMQSEAPRQRAELVLATGRHLVAMLNDLLDMSAIEAGKLTLRPESFDLGAELRQLAEVYTTRAAAAGQLFEARLKLQPGLVVQADRVRLRQVLENLLGNAVKFTPAGGTITLEVVPLAQSLCRFVVRDTGPGIGPKELEKLFSRFEPGRSKQTEGEAVNVKGSGLGLSIAKELVNAMGGDLQCESRLKQGTTFSFVLPLEAGAREAPRAQASAAKVAKEFPERSKGLVLLVDDDPVSTLVAQAALERGGWGVQCASSGEEALQVVTREQGRIRVVLMDCDMPGIGGLEATRRIRAWERASGADPSAIVAVTGRTRSVERQECLAAGMVGVLTKPFSMNVLAAIVSAYATMDAGGSVPALRTVDGEFRPSMLELSDHLS